MSETNEEQRRADTRVFMEENVQKYREKIWELAEAILTAEGMELVEAECLKMPSRWLIRIFIDREGGVTIHDCSEISHQLGDVLNVHDVPPGPYTLEVSSPGLDRPLVRDKDFLKYRGSTVNIRLREKFAGSKHFKGELIDFIEDDGQQFLIVDVSGTSYRIPRQMVAKANRVYNSAGEIMEDS
ncbi:MAG: ribosome maturation factor RimP [Syntrophus sp. (in: bacteria)]|nr:ribosome maturation factor RimP [Syntrophus sp. (in: bacteria)]